MPTDAGVVTRAEVGQWREVFSGLPGYDPKHTPLKLLTTIEQFADALRRVLLHPDPPCWSNEHCPCANCNARRLLAAYDGVPANDNRKDG